MYINLLIFVVYIFDKLSKILSTLFLHLYLKQTSFALALFREDVIQLQDVNAIIFLFRYI